MFLAKLSDRPFISPSNDRFQSTLDRKTRDQLTGVPVCSVDEKITRHWVLYPELVRLVRPSAGPLFHADDWPNLSADLLPRRWSVGRFAGLVLERSRRSFRVGYSCVHGAA